MQNIEQAAVDLYEIDATMMEATCDIARPEWRDLPEDQREFWREKARAEAMSKSEDGRLLD